MKAIIWGSCGSLPSPTSSATIRKKVVDALWAAREENFEDRAEVERFLAKVPHRMSGTYRANTSCVQIETDEDAVILCDAGTGIRDYALSLPEGTPPRTYHIFISHLHWDHIQGFPFFRPAFQKGNRIIFHGFHGETENVIRRQMEAPCFPVPFSAMQADIEFDIREEGASFQIGAVHVKTIKQQHPGASWGYRFEEGGKTVVFSSDSEHGPDAKAPGYSFVKFFAGADVLIFDGQYTVEEALNEKRDWGHSNHVTAVELAMRARVKQLVIFHHEPGYSDEKIEELREEALAHLETRLQTEGAGATRYPKELCLAYDGLVLEA